MKFVKVDEVPRMGHKRNELKAQLEDFMAMHVKTVKVEWQGTYKTAQYAQCNLSRGAKNWALPIDVRRIKDEIYMIRRDM